MKLVLVCCCVIIGLNVYGQDSLSISKKQYRGLMPYLENGGHGEHFSCNLESVFLTQGKYSFSGWMGIGFNGLSAGWKNLRVQNIPVGLIVFRGFKDHHIQFGLGLSYERFIATPSYSELILTPSFGYRYQTFKNNLFFKAFLSPGFKMTSFSQSDYQREGTLRNSLIGLVMGYYFPFNNR